MKSFPSGKMLAWLALVGAMGVGGWYAGKGMHRSALEQQAKVDEVVAQSGRSEGRGQIFPAGSTEDAWMQKVRAAETQDYYQLCMEWEDAFEWNEDYQQGYAPNAINALKWLMGQWLEADLDGFLYRAHDVDVSAAADVLAEWMPDRAFELLLDGKDSGIDKNFIRHVAGALARRHSDRFLESARLDEDIAAFADGWQWTDAIHEIVKTDAYRAARLCALMKFENESDYHELALTIAKAWKEGDPPISTWVSSLEDPKLKNVFQHARLSVLAEAEPERALEELHQVKLDNESLYYENAARHVLKHYAVKDPVKAIRLLSEIEAHHRLQPDRYGDDNPFDLDAEESHEFTVWENQSPFSHLVDDGAREEVLEAIADKLPNDPAKFLESIQAFSSEAAVGDALWNHQLQVELIHEKSFDWTVDECFAAAQAWRPMMHEDADDYALRSIARQAAFEDPYRALKRVDEYPVSDRAFLLSEIIELLPDKETAVKKELLQRLPLEEWDDDIGEVMGRQAVEYAGMMGARASRETQETVKSFVSSWAEQDPQAAAQWATALPDQQVMTHAVEGLMWQWMQYDVDGVAAWAKTLPSGRALDVVSVDLVSNYRRDKPELAWQWAAAISDANAKVQNYGSIASSWTDAPEAFHQAHEEARAAIGLPPKQLEEVNP